MIYKKVNIYAGNQKEEIIKIHYYKRKILTNMELITDERKTLVHKTAYAQQTKRFKQK